jgi:hypothetical protein
MDPVSLKIVPLLLVLVATGSACDTPKPSVSHPEPAPPTSVAQPSSTAPPDSAAPAHLVTPPNSVSVALPDSTAVAPRVEAMLPVPVDTEPVAGTGAARLPSEPHEWLSYLAKGVDSSVTLRVWMAGHPADVVSRTMPTGMFDEPFCRSAAALVSTGTRVWRRSAVFLIPPPPSGESLPDTTAVAERLCRLRALWLESGDKDSLSAERAAVALQGRLSRTLGEAQPGVLIAGPGTGRWLSGASWINGLRVIVVGADPGGQHWIDEDTPSGIDPPTVAALSYVIGNGLETDVSPLIDKMEYPKVEPEALVAMARADSSIGWSGMSGLTPLRRLFAHHRDSTRFKEREERPPPDASVDSVLVHALAALRDSSTLPPPKRSAAFLAADVAVQVHAPALDYTGRDSAYRQLLEPLGAGYEDRHLGAAYFYLHRWLWRAYQLDSLGPAGRSAFAELLRTGWFTGPGCGGAEEVITRGERALGAGVVDPMVHLYTAQAYADLFSLSPEGVRKSDSDSARSLAAKSEVARRRAIEHYRNALAGIRDPGHRRSIWTNAVHLMLRRPIDPRYICDYD